MQKLQFSENRRGFVTADGKPFVWIADTAWTLPARLKWDDVNRYMTIRKKQGFTVLQLVVLDPEFNAEMRDPCGDQALEDGDLRRPNETYFRYVDYVLDQAEAFGFYVLLLPVWGQLVVGDNWAGGVFPKTVTQENAYGYGAWLGRRLRHRQNLLWCLGGDRMPIHKGVDYRTVWRALAEGLAKGLTGETLQYDRDHEKWKDLMITYHACHEAETGLCSTFSYWTDEEAWISFIMLQSGHGVGVKNYELVRQEYERARVMPVWDGEPAYEMMPTSWPVKDEDSYHGTRSVRLRAYNSLFAGAFGYTYGHASVWCMISEKERSELARLTWYEALHSEGAGQVKILRDFLESYALNNCVPCQEVLLRQSAAEDDWERHEQACWDAQRKRLFVYFSGKTAEEIDLSALQISKVYGMWLDPTSGSCSEVFCPEITDKRIRVENRGASAEDQILILAADPADLPMTVGCYGEDEATLAAQKVFAW